MSKTRDTGYLANVIQVHDTGVRIMSGSTMLMAISSSGAVTITGEMSGSDAANALLLSGTGSVGFTTTGSFLAVSSSQQQISSSLLQVSASYVSLSGSYTTFSGSVSTRTTQIEQVYATTGSNSFRATQSITGSLTVTGQIIAQSLNVQQVTSSIVYSSGSNVFGCDINSRQTFTGSFYQTGSIALFTGKLEVNQSANNRLVIDCVNIGNEPRISSLDSSNNPQYLTISSYDLKVNANGNRKLYIDNTGVSCFSCQVCAPQYITTQGSSISYTTGTNYTVWNSENESCIQDSNNPAAYTRIKTWIADRSGCATIRYTGYIQSGPTYWGYRVTRNGTSSYMCVAYSDCIQPGCASANVHAYSSYQFNVGPFLPGDCIGLDVVSTGGGATPIAGQGQWIYSKEFRVFSSTPNLSAGTSGNVFGEWVGIGTCTPFSNLYINSNNSAAYDATSDNGQDGCGVTLTVRNNSTVTNSFAQLNLQVSGDSGRAVGRIALIRRDSATSDMAFITECGNTKLEKMRIYAGGGVSKPYQPFAMGGIAGDQTISTSNPTKINFVTTTGHFQCNVGGHWNNSTNQFTAPITGVYLVNISGYWSLNNMINQFAAFINSNRKVSIPTGYCTNIAGGSMMVPMTSGESMDFRVYNDVGTGTLYQNVYHTFFSIYLLG